MKKNKSGFSGIRLLSYIYLLAAIFFAAAQILFYSRILFLGAQARPLAANLIKIALIFIPAYLFIELPRLKPQVFYLVVFFHSFFIINAFLMISEKYFSFGCPVLRVAGIFGSLEYSFRQIAVICLNIILNFAMLMYVINRKKLFLVKADGK